MVGFFQAQLWARLCSLQNGPGRWDESEALLSFPFLLASGEFFCAGYDSSSARKGTGPWVSGVEGNTAFSFILPNQKCACGKQPLNCVCSYSCVQTQGPNWHRACDASALAFNSQPELTGLIDRQQTERFLQWVALSSGVWYMALMESGFCQFDICRLAVFCLQLRPVLCSRYRASLVLCFEEVDEDGKGSMSFLGH